MKSITSAVLVAVLLLVSRVGVSSAPDKADKATPFEKLKPLVGNWEKDGPDGKKSTLEFHLTAGGTVLVENMFAGTKYEMMNAYHMDGDNLVMTHYCAQGVQPRLKMSSDEANVIKFDFLDCTNIKDGAGCMGGLEMTIDGDKLTEKWFYRMNGELGKPDVFEFTRVK